MNTLEQLKINNDFIKGLFTCLNDSQLQQAQEIIKNNNYILNNDSKKDPFTDITKKEFFLDNESLIDLLLNRGLPTTKALITLCNKAIDKQGAKAFKLFINEFADYKEHNNIRNLNEFFNTCLCNFKDTGRTPYSNRH